MMINRKEFLLAMEENNRKDVLLSMCERAEQAINESSNEGMAAELLQIVDEMYLREQERLENESHVHITFSPSNEGSLKVALSKCGKRMESRVMHWDDFYAYGPIWKLHTEEGIVLREQWLMERFNNQLFLVFKNRENRLNLIMERLAQIPDHHRIYLWGGDNTHDQVAVRLVLYALRGKPNDIHILNVTREYQKVVQKYQPDLEPRSIGHVPFNALIDIVSRFETAEPISRKTRDDLVDDWIRLSHTTDTLRIWKNGDIVGLEENAFDEDILEAVRSLQNSGDENNVQDGYVKAGRIAAELIDRNIFDSDSYFQYRIWHLVSTGQLQFKGIPYAMYLYNVKIRE
ncbi:DUF1835 domain-containing protein [Paenibacillus sp. KQZ6P-2]|uniref:DUF1835 domain-containing protein n=2 Tax=Paenibacillus mangrovi TaxID=2931978 RepID=A0A9X2B2D6_9BACL|nr:DUF1835 domain-containing protein [Paenibacillus mangrovi]